LQIAVEGMSDDAKELMRQMQETKGR